MKNFFVLLILFTLAVNSFTAVGVCYMEHESQFQHTLEQSQLEVMPCHDDINNKGIDLCDCDSSVQFLYSVTSIQFPVNPISAASFNRLEYTSLDLNLNYRPPIKFSI